MRLEPVEAPIHVRTKESKWVKLIEEFIESGEDSARVIIERGDGILSESVAKCCYRAAKGYHVRVRMINGETYLFRIKPEEE